MQYKISTDLLIKKFLSFANALGINSIKFLPFMPHKDVLEILKNKAKITIIPNAPSIFNFFSFPVKLLEYMITSNIVISADTPVIKEIIKDEVNGFLFKTGDAKSLAKVIEKVINLPSEDLLKMTESVYNVAKNFTYEKKEKFPEF